MSTAKRYCLFSIGLFFVALGISCAVKGELGTAPISSFPYVLSLRYPVSLGLCTFIVNMLFLLGQILILRRKFERIQLLQIPMTGIFGGFIDFTSFLLGILTPETYISKFAIMLFGVVSLGFGVALEIIGSVITLPGEGIVKAISSHWQIDFGKTKISFDTGIVLVASCFSWLYFGEIHGIREGTLITALLTGIIARFFIQHLSYLDHSGQPIFCFPWSKPALQRN